MRNGQKFIADQPSLHARKPPLLLFSVQLQQTLQSSVAQSDTTEYETALTGASLAALRNGRPGAIPGGRVPPPPPPPASQAPVASLKHSPKGHS